MKTKKRYHKSSTQAVTDNYEQIGADILDGLGLLELAEKYGLRYRGLRTHLLSLDMSVPKKPAPNKNQCKYSDQAHHLEFVKRELDNGESLLHICEANNLHYSYFYKQLRDHGSLNRNRSDIVRARQSATKRTFDDKAERLIIDEYTSGISIYALAEKHGVIAGVIFGILQRNSVPRNNQSIYWTDKRREHYREMSHAGVIGVHAQGDDAYRFTEPESAFASWCDQRGIQYTRQYQLTPNTHRFDFHLIGTNVLVEIDGVYWHNTPMQKAKDEAFDCTAEELGFTVVRFTDIEITSTKKMCFYSVLDTQNVI